MPDFRAYIKEHLPPLGGSGAKEAEIIRELALDFEERYKSAIRGGHDPGEAWRKIQSLTEWPKLARDFTAMLASAPPDPPKRLIPMLNFWNDVRYCGPGRCGRTLDSRRSRCSRWRSASALI